MNTDGRTITGAPRANAAKPAAARGSMDWLDEITP